MKERSFEFSFLAMLLADKDRLGSMPFSIVLSPRSSLLEAKSSDTV